MPHGVSRKVGRLSLPTVYSGGIAVKNDVTKALETLKRCGVVSTPQLQPC